MDEREGGRKNKIIVRVDRDLEEITPGYLRMLREDVTRIKGSLERDDWETIRLIGHNMKGSGSGYGFEEVSRLGRLVEQSAQERSGEQARRVTEEISRYLENVEVVYADPPE
jgi:HPt (histidine-containing phosphotransfer) domain-containing protein